MDPKIQELFNTALKEYQIGLQNLSPDYKNTIHLTNNPNTNPIFNHSSHIHENSTSDSSQTDFSRSNFERKMKYKSRKRPKLLRKRKLDLASQLADNEQMNKCEISESNSYSQTSDMSHTCLFSSPVYKFTPELLSENESVTNGATICTNGHSPSRPFPNRKTTIIFNKFKYFPDYNNESGHTHYICHICFYEILNDGVKYKNHISKCSVRHGGVFLAELDNAKLVYDDRDHVYDENSTKSSRQLYLLSEPNKIFAARLCHFGRFFVESKSDEDTYADKFDYFLLYSGQNRAQNNDFIGYFSKERENDAINEIKSLSCLMVLPNFTRQGHGTFLIDYSYKMAKVLAKQTNFSQMNSNSMTTLSNDFSVSPERPLSYHGLLSYRAYWKNIVLCYVKKIYKIHEKNITSAKYCSDRDRSNSINPINPILPKFDIKTLSINSSCNCRDLITSMQWQGWLKQIPPGIQNGCVGFQSNCNADNNKYRMPILPAYMREGSCFFVVIDDKVVEGFDEEKFLRNCVDGEIVERYFL